MAETVKMNLSTKLEEIQCKMKAPKNMYNNFGKYKYRNCEGILEAFKPYGDLYCAYLTLSDSIQMIGDRFYVVATATIHDCDSDEEISVQAFAREPANKKGMDESQITGASSSYARKYALNGLLLLDDTKDPDTDEYHEQTHREEPTQQQRKSNPNNRVEAKKKTILAVCKAHKLTPEELLKANPQWDIKWETANEDELDTMIDILRKNGWE